MNCVPRYIVIVQRGCTLLIMKKCEMRCALIYPGASSASEVWERSWPVA